MNASNLLECAAALMELRGHCNDGPGETRRQVCALEAIAMAAGGKRERYFAVVHRSAEAREAVTALASFIGRDDSDFAHLVLDTQGAGGYFAYQLAAVYGYNDQPERTVADMTAAMRGAAAILKAKQSAENALYHLQMACV